MDDLTLKSSFQDHGYLYDSSKVTEQKNKKSNGSRRGFVNIVGAGPSDPELLTIKALKAIQKAEVLVYDRLVSREIIALANPEAKHIYVGKRCGRPSFTQDEINHILVEQAKLGYQVVRLKGGDPLIFGRGGEEALALVEANLNYQFIPGITAAIGCASSALIPLTHRKVSRSVTLVTGHVVQGAIPTWSLLVAEGQTLVFYMGLEKAADIQSGLLRTGLSDSTPFAIVCHGCSATQRVYTGELKDLLSMATDLQGESPALIIVGEVVKLREQLQQTAAQVSQQLVAS